MSEENKARTRQFYEEVINKKDLDLMDEYCVSDFIDHNPDPGQGQGLEGVKESFRQALDAFPDLHLAIDDMIAEGDKVVSRLTFSGTHKAEFAGIPASGKSFSVPVIDIIRIVDGKAVERWGLYDSMSMMQQIGAMPGPEGA